MTHRAHFPVVRALVTGAVGLLIAPAALARDAKPAPPATSPAPAATGPAAPAPGPAAAPVTPSDDPDAYLAADFPNATQVAVDPPIDAPRSEPQSVRESDDDERPPSRIVYSEDYEARRQKKRPTGPGAAERGPFLTGTLDILLVDSYFGIIGGGISGGTFLADRFRVGLTLAAPFEFSTNNIAESEVNAPKAIFGGTAGIALVRRQAFALSFAADISTTTSSDLGWNVGASVPLDWVTRGGFRVGLVPGIFQNIGASGKFDCGGYRYVGDAGGYTSCSNSGGTAKAATGLHLQGHIGFTFK